MFCQSLEVRRVWILFLSEELTSSELHESHLLFQHSLCYSSFQVSMYNMVWPEESQWIYWQYLYQRATNHSHHFLKLYIWNNSHIKKYSPTKKCCTCDGELFVSCTRSSRTRSGLLKIKQTLIDFEQHHHPHSLYCAQFFGIIILYLHCHRNYVIFSLRR